MRDAVLPGVGSLLWVALIGNLLPDIERGSPSSADRVAVEVLTVTNGGPTAPPVVVLKDTESSRALPIFIGVSEANAIWSRLRRESSPRPLTHDLMKSLIDRSDLRLERVVITGVRNNTYLAELHLRFHQRTLVVDSRPSDAIALALRCETPILAARELLESAEAIDLGERSAPVRFGGLTLQPLTPGLAASLGVEAEAGVVIADVQGGRFAGQLARGDVLVAVDHEPVREPLEVAMRLRTIGTSAVHLTVLRKGRRAGVSVPEVAER